MKISFIKLCYGILYTILNNICIRIASVVFPSVFIEIAAVTEIAKYVDVPLAHHSI